MKKYIAFNWLLALGFLMSNAQIDRTKAPSSSTMPEIKFGEVKQFELTNGLRTIVVENHKLPEVRISLALDLPPISEGDKVGVSSFVGDLMRAGTTTYSKEEIDIKIDELGSTFSIYSKGAAVSTLTKYVQESAAILSEIVKRPTFANQKELDKLKKQSISSLELNVKDPSTISKRVKKVLLYGKDHPYGEYETKESLSAITLEDVKAYYNQYFNASNAYLTIVGDIDYKEAKKIAEKYFADWRAGTQATVTLLEPKNLPTTEIDLVDVSNLTQSTITITNLTDLKKSNNDFFAANLSNKILGAGGFSSRLFQNIREDKGWTYGAYSAMVPEQNTRGTFEAYAEVRNEVTDSAVEEMMKELKSITSQESTQTEIAVNKSRATGVFALQLEKPQTTANFMVEQITANLGEDFYKNYLKNLNDINANQILEAAKHYIKPAQARIVIVGKAEEIAPSLKRLGYPIKYFDRYGNPTEDPTIKKSVTDVTADQVIERYFDAIGGRSEAEKVISFKAIYQADLMGETLILTDIKAAPNKMMNTITMAKMGDMELSRVVFNGEKGYVKSPQSKEDFDEAKNKEYSQEHSIFPQLKYQNSQLKGISKINDKDCYEISFNNKTEFYDTTSGLLVREVRIEEQGGETVAITSDFNKYQKINGLSIPSEVELIAPGAPALKFKLKEAAFNVELSDLDFQ